MSRALVPSKEGRDLIFLRFLKQSSYTKEASNGSNSDIQPENSGFYHRFPPRNSGMKGLIIDLILF